MCCSAHRDLPHRTPPVTRIRSTGRTLPAPQPVYVGRVRPSPRFTFVRHGQCVANAQGRVVGQLDSPLTPLGHTQAEGAAVLLAGRRDLTAV
ncbi:MAG TPA: histidine phosphatase family protein, partial [Propionibacterium sp.]|nr:histidine phosphatase family protein [Propionibacterium sp.]